MRWSSETSVLAAGLRCGRLCRHAIPTMGSFLPSRATPRPALAIPVLRMLGSSDVRRWIGPTAWWPRRSFAPRFDGRSSECVGSPLSRCGGTCLPPFARTSAAATAALVAAPDTPEEAHRAQRRRTSFPERPLPHGAGRPHYAGASAPPACAGPSDVVPRLCLRADGVLRERRAREDRRDRPLGRREVSRLHGSDKRGASARPASFEPWIALGFPPGFPPALAHLRGLLSGAL